MERYQHKHGETSPTALMPIWLHRLVASRFHDNNDQYRYNSPEETLAWIAESLAQAKKEGCVDITIIPVSKETDDHGNHNAYIEIWGYRQESPAQTKTRLLQLKSKAKYDQQNVVHLQNQIDYFSGPVFAAHMKQLNDAIALVTNGGQLDLIK